MQVRMSPALLAAIDRECARLAKARPGVGVVSRAMAIREIVGRALLGRRA